MQTATVSFHARGACLAFVVSTLAAAMSCGGSEADGEDSADSTANGGATAATGPSANSMPSQGAASSAAQSPATNPSAASPTTPGATPNEADTTPASVDAAGVGAACNELGTSDACGACVCRECGAELDACANTPGCPEILACVRENACSGSDCFCGDAALPRCFAGGGDGPCKAVVLAAPGGREPTLDNPSGGPASDAALEVGECAEDDDGCADVCDVGL